MIHLVRTTLHDKNAEVTGDHVRMEICHILMWKGYVFPHEHVQKMWIE
jgi:hypothetical protein